MENSNTFEYTYSSKRQEEIEKIKKKYLPQEKDKMETLRRLDRSAETAGTIWGLILGIVGTLIMGGGMSMCMVLGGSYMIPGIVVGLVGIVFLSMAYPVYKRVVQKKREQIAPQILALTEELLKSE